MRRRKPSRQSRQRKGSARRVGIERLENRCLLSANSLFPPFEVDDSRQTLRDRRDDRSGHIDRSVSAAEEARALDHEIGTALGRDFSPRGAGGDRIGSGDSRRLNDMVASRRVIADLQPNRREEPHRQGGGRLPHDSLDAYDRIPQAHSVAANVLIQNDFVAETSLVRGSVDFVLTSPSFDRGPIREGPARDTLSIVLVSLTESRVPTSLQAQSDFITDPISSRPAVGSQSQRATEARVADVEMSKSNGERTTLDDPTAVTAFANASGESEAKSLISAIPPANDGESFVASVAAAAVSSSFRSNLLDANVAASDEFEHSEIGEWLHRAAGLHDKFSELENLLDEISSERLFESNATGLADVHGTNVSSFHQRVAGNEWLDTPGGTIVLLPAADVMQAASEESEMAVADVDQVAMAGWTVGIGFFRAFEEVAEASSTPIVLFTGQPVAALPSNTPAVSESKKTDGHDESNAFSTRSTNGAFGFMVGCAGVYLLRNRRRRGEGDAIRVVRQSV